MSKAKGDVMGRLGDMETNYGGRRPPLYLLYEGIAVLSMTRSARLSPCTLLSELSIKAERKYVFLINLGGFPRL